MPIIHRTRAYFLLALFVYRCLCQDLDYRKACQRRFTNMTSNDKSHSQYIDNIGIGRSDSSSIHNALSEFVDKKGPAEDGDEIVQNLAQAGEKVGMTWHSIVAAGVSPLSSSREHH